MSRICLLVIPWLFRNWGKATTGSTSRSIHSYDNSSISQFIHRQLHNRYDKFSIQQLKFFINWKHWILRLRDPWLIFIVLNKLNSDTKGLWARDFSTIERFLEFFAQCMSWRHRNLNQHWKNFIHQDQRIPNHFWSRIIPIFFRCPICKTDQHKLFECDEFHKLLVEERRRVIS